MPRNLRLIIALFCTLGAPPASAFGTIVGDGQKAEHERITRHALGCEDSTIPNCFEPDILTQLAGARSDCAISHDKPLKDCD